MIRRLRGVRMPDVSHGVAPKNLALVGFMGCGKSSTGRMLASLLQFKFVDTDDWIEKKAGKRISEIFATEGEPAFRKLESDVVRELEGLQRCVISTGGGLIVNPENLESLKKHAMVFCLWASPETLYERVKNQNHRPLLNDPDPARKIRTLLEARTPAYRNADVLVSTERRSLREVAQHIANHFRAVNRHHAS
ncbi:MAG: shikimate kinase [Verrucomicrobia bacterium]|nr:shikimate kinase [Verrucomicrobiota bacterium]